MLLFCSFCYVSFYFVRFLLIHFSFTVGIFGRLSYLVSVLVTTLLLMVFNLFVCNTKGIIERIFESRFAVCGHTAVSVSLHLLSWAFFCFVVGSLLLKWMPINLPRNGIKSRTVCYRLSMFVIISIYRRMIVIACLAKFINSCFLLIWQQNNSINK